MISLPRIVSPLRRRRALCAGLCVAAFLAPSPGAAQTAVDTSLVMDDGIALDALYALPAVPPPPGGYPCILWIHGFGGTKNDVRDECLADAHRGYATAAYSVRGQGASGGTFDFFSSARTLADLRAMIAFTGALPGADGARVGVAGASQGGLLAWEAAAFDLGARCAVSRIANGRYDEDFAADNALNWTFARTISLAQVRIEPAFRDSVNRAVSGGDIGYVRAYLAAASTALRERGTTAPVAMLSTYFDGYFSPTAALRQLAGIGGPARVTLAPGGHALPTDPAQRAYYTAVQDAWLDYWLKDDPAAAWVAQPDSAVILFDAATGEERAFPRIRPEYWLDPTDPPPPGVTKRTWYLDPAGLSETPDAIESSRQVSYTNLIGGTTLTFRTDPFPAGAIFGGPHGSATLVCDGSGTQYQMNVLVFDVDPSGAAAPLTRGYHQVAANVPGIRDTLPVALNAALYTVAAGHRLEVRVHGGVAFAPNPSVDFGNVALGPPFNSTNTLYFGGNLPSSLTLYTLDPAIFTASRPPAAAAPSALDANRPNPVRTATEIPFTLGRSGAFRVDVTDALGRVVAVLADGVRASGRYTVPWNAAGVASGLYIVRLSTAGTTSTKPVVVAK